MLWVGRGEGIAPIERDSIGTLPYIIVENHFSNQPFTDYAIICRY